MSPHWSQKGSKTIPHAEEHESSPPGYHSSPHAPAPPGHPARQSSLPLICISFMKTVPMSHSSISTSAGGRPPCICLLANARVRPMAPIEEETRADGGNAGVFGAHAACSWRGPVGAARAAGAARSSAAASRGGAIVHGAGDAEGRLDLLLPQVCAFATWRSFCALSWFRKVCGATGGSRLGILVVAFGNGIVLPWHQA